MLRAILVDDEPLARERLRALLGEVGPEAGEVEILAEAGSGKEAVLRTRELQPDLLFLDVQMPGLDGFDVLDLLVPPRPHVVFVTAYDEYALRAFDAHALDYLTKPVRRERLARSLRRVAALVAAREPDPALDALGDARREVPLAHVALQAGRRLRIVEPAEVRYFEAQDKVVLAHFEGKTYPVDFTLQALEERLGGDRFLRVHRAFLVNVAAVRELVPWFSGTYRLTLDGGETVPLARRRVRDVKRILRGA
ncbi:MAG: LytTR family transcriptional regulator DNA-binding domain-containing protein [Bacteroidota bacterium]